MTSRNVILARMERLLCLSLEGAPASKIIATTAEVWIGHLSHFDERRLHAMFDAIERSAKRRGADRGNAEEGQRAAAQGAGSMDAERAGGNRPHRAETQDQQRRGYTMKFCLACVAALLGVGACTLSVIYAGRGDYAHACWLLLLGNMNFDTMYRILKDKT